MSKIKEAVEESSCCNCKEIIKFFFQITAMAISIVSLVTSENSQSLIEDELMRFRNSTGNIQSNITVLQAEVYKLSQKLSGLEITSLEEKIKQLTDQAAGLDASSLRSDLNKTISHLNTAQNDLNSLQSSINTLQDDLNKYKANIVESTLWTKTTSAWETSYGNGEKIILPQFSLVVETTRSNMILSLNFIGQHYGDLIYLGFYINGTTISGRAGMICEYRNGQDKEQWHPLSFTQYKKVPAGQHTITLVVDWGFGGKIVGGTVTALAQS
jgi:hypothetical protein